MTGPRYQNRHQNTDTMEDPRVIGSRFTLDDRLPADYLAASLRADVVRGLSASPKTLPPKWFYDELGSKLFELITELPEYYPTRAEQEILEQRATEIAELSRAQTLVELGSGSSRKTRVLLDALTELGTIETYAPLDVSPSALREAGEALCDDYRPLRVSATVTDFEVDLALPSGDGPRLVAFLGGTLGNFDTASRAGFYRNLRDALGPDDSLLLGVDLVKNPDVLVPAYDDRQGVTALFNKNVLNVVNRELGADFDPDAFGHVALWNAHKERIEMHLRSLTRQTVRIPMLGMAPEFGDGELLRTEISVKFRRAGLVGELANGGFGVRRWWTDKAGRFALLLAIPARVTGVEYSSVMNT